MQAKPKFLHIFLVTLVASLLLSACTGGGDTGSTWFNLPSLKVKVQEDGTAKVYGLPVNQVVLPPEVIQQLQAADVQNVDLRVGYNGVHAYIDGEDMPYLAWDEEGVGTLQDIVKAQPDIPNAGMIASALPWLRKVGLGASIVVPAASGQQARDIPNWKGETEVTPETAENPIGPMTFGGLAFDDQGQASIQGMPLSELEEALDTSFGLQLDPSLIAMLKSVGGDSIGVSTNPNGIALSLGDKALPGLAYDSASLDRAIGVAGAFVDEATAGTLNQVAAILPNAEVNTVVSLTGEPLVETELAKIPVEINDDGTLNVFGLPVTSEPVLDPEILAQLQDANIQQLDVDINEEGLSLAANGKALPSIGWDEESMTTLAGIVGPLAGISPELIDTGLSMVSNTGIQASVALPVTAGAAKIDIPDEIDMTMTPADLGDMSAPTIHATAVFDKDGSLKELAGLSAASLAALGVSDIALPPETAATLADLGAEEIRVFSEPNKLIVSLDGSDALTINHDEKSLANALELATPFLADTPLADPYLNEMLSELILPLVPAADLDITLNLE